MTTTKTQTPTVHPGAVDPDIVGAFTGRLYELLVGGSIILLIDVGYRAGLFRAAAGAGALTSDELATRAGASERHVREWLAGMVTADVFTYEPETARYELPASHAAVLTGPGSSNIGPTAGALAMLARHVPAVTRTLLEGGGIPYDDYRPEFTTCMDQMMRRIYDDTLVDDYIASVPGLGARLASGVSVADIGCGSGHTTNLLAQAFGASTFVGYDIASDALELARAEASELGLTNVRFENVDVAELAPPEPFDVVLAFDCIHDQARPAEVLAAVRAALVDGGLFMAVDVGISSALEENLENPIAPQVYASSLFHCMQVSLAEGGAGLGTGWGRQVAVRMFADAGFEDVRVLETPGEDPMNAIFVGQASSARS